MRKVLGKQMVFTLQSYAKMMEPFAFADDVGRRNAVDKAIGINALNKNDFDMYFLALSGRLTGDVTLKGQELA